MEIQVLYEDNHIIAVYKPAGILVQEDKTGDPSLLDQVKYYLKNKYHKPGNVFLGLVHRLDRPVAGVIVFGKTSKGAARLSEQFRVHSVEKIYHAVVCGQPKEKRAKLVHYLQKEEKNNRVEISDNLPDPSLSRRGEGWLRAELSYEVIKSNEKYSLVKIKLGTGRPHQIRAQMSAIGCPIVGDVKYGAPSLRPVGSGGSIEPHVLCLAATSLSFETATTEETVKVESPLPEAWNKFI